MIPATTKVAARSVAPSSELVPPTRAETGARKPAFSSENREDKHQCERTDGDAEQCDWICPADCAPGTAYAAKGAHGHAEYKDCDKRGAVTSEEWHTNVEQQCEDNQRRQIPSTFAASGLNVKLVDFDSTSASLLRHIPLVRLTGDDVERYIERKLPEGITPSVVGTHRGMLRKAPSIPPAFTDSNPRTYTLPRT